MFSSPPELWGTLNPQRALANLLFKIGSLNKKNCSNNIFCIFSLKLLNDNNFAFLKKKNLRLHASSIQLHVIVLVPAGSHV